MSERLLTPSKVTAWLDCEHYLTLKHAVEAGTMARPSGALGSFARLLMDKGQEHELACLEELRAEGRDVCSVPGRPPAEAFTEWVARVGDHLTDGNDVLYQMPLEHLGIRGIADFLLRVESPSGVVSYEPVDAKLARSEAKVGHVLQLCFYAEAIEAATGVLPEQLHVWLGSGRWESIRTVEVLPYWRRLRAQLSVLLAQEDTATAGTTEPVPCAHCEFCEFADGCNQVWRDGDALHFVAGIRKGDRKHLEAAGVSTLGDLATTQGPVEGLDDDRLTILRTQAGLQQLLTDEDDLPSFLPIDAADEPPWGHGFSQLPEPDDGDVFLDFEGHPFWRADTGLLFLFGLLVQEDGEWTYVSRWAHDEVEEQAAAQWLVEFLRDRRVQHPGMHVLHYNHTERSALQELFNRHDLPDRDLEALVREGTLVDLYPIVRNAVQVGTESYGLKHLERLAGFERGHDIDAGAGAVLEYEAFMTRVAPAGRLGLTDGHAEELRRIAAYNQDDVLATRALRDWLVAQRPADVEWRSAVLDPDDDMPDVDEQVAALQQHPAGSPEHLLGDMLEYWRREGRAFRAQRLAKLDGAPDQLRADPDVVADIEVGDWFAPIGKRGKPLMERLRLTFPPDQELNKDARSGEAASLMFVDDGGATRYLNIVEADADAGTVDVRFDTEKIQLQDIPSALAVNDAARESPKPQRLSALAEEVIESGGIDVITSAARRLLTGEGPRFVAGGGPPGHVFEDDLDQMIQCTQSLDNSVLAIQGPPGTGKTWRGARIIRQLLVDGKRVGVTAQSHAAIGNLLSAVVEAMEEDGVAHLLRGIKKGRRPLGLPGIEWTEDNAACGKPTYNLVGGTTWLFASRAMADSPVDVLVVDEAGQLSLADTTVAAMAAENLLLLGDPQQLAHVSIASHPGGSGASVLEHVLEGKDTIPADRGFFLGQTWRMHPDVCGFISDVIYEGRLTSHPSCAVQSTDAGTGLRWLEVEHEGCSTSSEVEADAIVTRVKELLGSSWTNAAGEKRAIGPDDIMIVAPYNDQKDLLKAKLIADPHTATVQVGTVDKFQGREAAVVFFSMTTSTAEDMPRGPEFLFSRNRLNVAISRARCLAYLVCTKELLDSRARTIDDMRLISTAGAFAERATGVG